MNFVKMHKLHFKMSCLQNWYYTHFRHTDTTEYITSHRSIRLAADHERNILNKIVYYCVNVRFRVASIKCNTGKYSRFIIFRPADIVCRRTYILPVFLLSFFLSFFFIRQLISELAERNSTISGHMVGSNCNLKMHVRNLGYPFPLQIGGSKTTFLGRLRNSTETLTAYIFGSKHDIDNRPSTLTSSQNVMNLGPQTASNSTPSLPTLRKFCILLHCQASQTEIRKQNSTKLCQVMGSKSP